MRESNKYGHLLLRELRTHAKENPEKAGHATLQVIVRYTGDIETLRKCGLIVLGDVSGVAIGQIDEANLESLEQLENVSYIGTEPPLRAQLNTSVPEIHGDVVRTGSPPYTGTGVVIGILDTGIDIFHKNFRKPDGTTRILSIWDQTLTTSGSQHPPAGQTIGVEFSAADIAAGLAHPDQPFGHLDANGHGTNVAGIAAGNGLQSDGCHGAGTYWGVAPDADLIIVKVLPDKTSPNRKTSLNLAAQYVFNTAAAQSPPKPAVVNASLSWGAGARDGTSPEETFLDGLLTSTSGRAIVISAGNDGGLGDAQDVSRGDYRFGSHAAKHINASGQAKVTLMFPPDDNTPDDIDIWYSAGAGRLQVQVTGPTGLSTGFVPVGVVSTTTKQNVGPAVVEVTSFISVFNSKGHISLVVDPPTNGSIPAGAWTITLKESAGTAVDMDLWIAGSHADPCPAVAFPDRVIASTLTSPGTAKNVITVGAYGSVDGKLADFSSRGPTLAADGRQKPDICAPGLEESPQKGIMAPKNNAEVGCCCNCCYDFYVDMCGTSQAAPHVTGVVALMMQKNSNLTFDQLRTVIQSFCRKPAGMSPLPNNDWGYGKVDAQLATANIPSGSAFAGNPPIASAPIGDTGEGIPTGTTPIGNERGSAGTPGAKAIGVRSPVIRPLPPLTEAFPRPSLRVAKALRNIAMRSKDNPAGQMLIALVSMHFDEVRKLINTNRRVATRWHRMFGPELLRQMLSTHRSMEEELSPVIPATINNRNVVERMRVLFDVLFRYGSDRLRKDVNRYGPLFLALPGATFSGLTSLPHPETQYGAGRNA
jgi:subtilisin family serine protease